MVRWIRLQMRLGDHYGLLILLAIFGIFVTRTILTLTSQQFVRIHTC